MDYWHERGGLYPLYRTYSFMYSQVSRSKSDERVSCCCYETRVITVHNHLSDRLLPSEVDKDITDRLIQVGRILNIQLIDHLIITIETYVIFKKAWVNGKIREKP